MGDLGYFDEDLTLRFLGRKAGRLGPRTAPWKRNGAKPSNTVNGVQIRSCRTWLQDPWSHVWSRRTNLETKGQK